MNEYLVSDSTVGKVNLPLRAQVIGLENGFEEFELFGRFRLRCQNLVLSGTVHLKVETFDEAELHPSRNPSLVIDAGSRLGIFGIGASSMRQLRVDSLKLDSVEFETLLASDTEIGRFLIH